MFYQDSKYYGGATTKDPDNSQRESSRGTNIQIFLNPYLVEREI